MSSDFTHYLKILGYTLDDESDAAEIARTWINASLDGDESWFEGRTDKEIKNAFQQWVRMVYPRAD